ncbi:MAG TPA: nitrous oxide reductase accessory protein NosL [Desulfomonilaceae bacterium]|nr:nitrous oxide reductase accessory protein NosL [Desulfomonilaceae bacterium]
MLAQTKRIFFLCCTAIILAWFHTTAMAAVVDLPDGSKLDLSAPCPVCTMKVETSSLGPAAVVFTDGKVVGFDTAGDLFRYVLEADKHTVDAKNIKNVFITEYGTKNFVDGKKAFFVVGSDLQGSMGPEIAGFSKKEDAESFKTEHKGKSVVSYSQITLEDLKSKKKMLKMQH